jgi:predicted esterase
MDIYSPASAPDTSRPCIVLIHGGSFLTGSKADTLMVSFCSEFALRGYITVSIDYRLGARINLLDPTSSQKEFNRAVYRASQDSKAAIRFLKANAAQYNIDTSKVFCGGYSAGAITAVHNAYMNQIEAIAKIDTTGLGLLENGENLDQPSTFKAAINYCGAIGDTTWLQAEDIPVISFHGTADTIVPISMGNAFKLQIFPVVYGSGAVNIVHKRLGVKDSLYSAPGEGHALSLITIALSVSKVSEFLYNIVEPSSLAIRPYKSSIKRDYSLVQSGSNTIYGLNGRIVQFRDHIMGSGVYIQNVNSYTNTRKSLLLKK